LKGTNLPCRAKHPILKGSTDRKQRIIELLSQTRVAESQNELRAAVKVRKSVENWTGFSAGCGRGNVISRKCT